MKIKTSFNYSILSGLLIILPAAAFAGGAQNSNAASFDAIDCPGYDGEGVNDGLSCFSVKGWSQGNHELDCTVIIPDNVTNKKRAPLIAWANGWEQGNVLGQCTTNGYLRGLKEWASSGYVVTAANQWSVQESDVLSCAKWVAGNATGKNSLVPFDGQNIGIVGHSQGGGAVIKAGNGSQGFSVTAVMTMNPYGPSWVNPENQDGQVLIVGGRYDTTSPPDSYQAVWDAISAQADPGGINAVLINGTHNSDAWNGTGDPGTFSCEDAAEGNFGAYQDIGMIWWDIQLKGKKYTRILKGMLADDKVWETPQYSNF
jgi:dienelactone hydrolase